MKNEKDLGQLGMFTLHPVNLYKVINEREYALLDFIRFRIANGEYYTSNSLLHLEMGFAKASTIKENKDTLIKLKFIKILEENKNKGTKYKILYDNICDIINKLNKTNNPIQRLIIADEYRCKNGLEPMHTNQIKKFTGSCFDYEVTNLSETKTSKETAGTKCTSCIDTLNNYYKLYKNDTITKRVYDVKCDKLIRENNLKIKFNNDLEKWILM